MNDPGLQTVISLKPMLVPHRADRHEHKKFGKTRVNIVERLVNHMMHFGKKYAKNTGRMGGKKQKSMSIVKTAFEIIELKTGQNPVQQLVRAIENASPNEDTTQAELRRRRLPPCRSTFPRSGGSTWPSGSSPRG